MRSLYGRIQKLVKEASKDSYTTELLIKEIRSILDIYNKPEYLSEAIPLNHLSELVIIFRNYEPILCNDKVKKYTGLSFPEIKKQDIVELFHPDDQVKLGPTLKKRREDLASDEFRFTHRLFHSGKNQYVWLETLESSLVDESGNVITFLTSRDVTLEQENIEKISELSELATYAANRICRTDNDFRLMYANSTFWNDFAIEESKGKGKKLSEVLTLPTDLSKMRIKDHYTTAVPIADRWYKVDISGISEKGKRSGLLWSFTDIDDQKRTEQALESTNRILSIIGKLSSDAIWIWDLDTNLIRLTGSIEEVLGLKQDKLTIEYINSIIHAEDLDEHRSRIAVLKESGGEYHNEIRMLHPDGSYRWLEIRARKADPNQIIGIIRDISIRKEYEQSLRNEKQQLDMIASGLPGAVYQFRYFEDGSFDFPYVSPSISTISELKPEDIYKDPASIFNLVHPDDLSGLWESIGKALENMTVWEHESRFLLQKEYKWLYGHATPNVSASGIITFTGVFLDITSKKQLEQKLEKSNSELFEAQKIARLGYYIFDATTGLWQSSEILDEIFGIDKHYRRDIEGWLHLVSQTDQDEMHKYLFQDVLSFTGEAVKKNAFDRIYPIFNQRTGKVKYLHGTGDVLFDEASKKPIKIMGVIQDITEHHEAQRKIVEQQKLLKISQEVAHVGHWLWDLKTFALEWSDETFRIWGYEPQSFEPGYKFYIESIHPDDRQEHLEAIEYGLQKNTFTKTQVRIRRKDGSIRFVEIEGQNYRVEDGKPVSVIGIVKDVTDEESFKRILAESEGRYRFINEFTTDGIWSWHPDTGAIALSKRFYKILELDPIDEVNYAQIKKYIHPDDLSVFQEGLGDLIKLDIQANFDLRCKTRGNSWKWIKVQAKAIRDTKRRVSQVIGTMQDVTEAKEAQNELVEKERRLRKAQETAQLGYWDYYPEGDHFFFSDDLKKLLGLSRTKKNPLTRAFLQQRSLSNSVPTRKALEEQLKAGKKIDYQHEIWVRNKKRWIKVIAEPLVDESGAVARITGVTQDITQHKETEQLLLEQKRSFENLNNNLPGVVSKHRIYQDGTNEVVYIGPHLKELYGLRPEEVKEDADKLWQKIHPEDNINVQSTLRAVADGLNDFNLKWRVHKSKEDTVWIHCLGSVSRNSNFLDIDMLLLDITREKEKEGKLIEFNRLFDISTDFFAIINKNGYFDHVNPQWKELTGYDFKEILNIPYSQLVHKDDQAQIHYYIEKLFERDYSSVEFTNRNLTASGEYIWLEWKLNFDEHSHRIYAVARDITDMKAYQSKLQNQEENMRFLAKSAMDFNALENNVNIYDYITKRIAELVGFGGYVAYTRHDKDLKEWETISICSVNHELDKRLHDPDIGLLGLKGKLDPEAHISQLSGTQRFIFMGNSISAASQGLISEEAEKKLSHLIDIKSTYVIGVSDENTLIGSISIVLADEEITRQGLIEAFCKQAGIAVRKYRLQKDLEEMNETKNKLFSFISHDLKSPFITLINLLNLLDISYSELDEKTIKDLIKQLTDKTKSIYGIFENMLIWSRNQSGLLSIRYADFNLGQLIHDCYGLLKFSASNKDIQVDLSNVNTEISIKADREMISSVVRNLLSNAIKFTGQHGKIEIGTKLIENSDKLLFRIADTGLGISEKDKQLIFDAKRHIVYNGTNNERGTGVGLALCKDFITRHGGEIWFESKENEGSTFYFTVPAYVENDL